MTAAAAPTYTRTYTSVVLALLFLMMMSHAIDRGIVGILAQPIKEELRLSDLQLGLLGGPAFALLYVIMGIPLAWLAERHNRVTIMSLSLLAWSGMTALCGVATSFAQLLLFRAGVGIGEAGGGPAAQAVISDYFAAERRTSALAIFSMGIPVGGVVGAIVGGMVAEAFGWRTAFVAVGLPGVLLAIVMKLCVREPPRGMSDPAALSAKAAGPPPPVWTTALTIWNRKSLRLFVTGVILTGIAANGISAFAAAYFVRRFGLGLGEVGLAMGLLGGLAMVVGTLIGGFVSDWAAKWDRRWYAWMPAIGTAISAPVYALIYMQETWAGVMALLWIPGIFQYLYLAPALALTQNMVAPRMRATAVAILTLVSSLITMGLGPVVMGGLGDTLAARAFAGDYGICSAAAAPGAAIAEACRAASTVGIQEAIIAATSLYAVSALFYALAARRIRQDLADTEAGR